MFCQLAAICGTLVRSLFRMASPAWGQASGCLRRVQGERMCGDKFVICISPAGGSGGGSGLSSPIQRREFWADSGPDPGGNLFLILILALSAARMCPLLTGHSMPCLFLSSSGAVLPRTRYGNGLNKQIEVKTNTKIFVFKVTVRALIQVPQVGAGSLSF
jgi:hypothetical protein